MQALSFRQAKTAFLLAASVSVCAFGNAHAQSVAIRTPIPQLTDDWAVATGGVNATLDDARRIADAFRPNLPTCDPFTQLSNMTCTERLARNERVVWEDAMIMAVVDWGNRGSKLLIVPKRIANIPSDLIKEQMAHVNRVAAATCDALVVAAGGQPDAIHPSCTMRINPPGALGVRQMHVHVEARTGVSAPVADEFLMRTASHLRILVEGGGCL